MNPASTLFTSTATTPLNRCSRTCGSLYLTGLGGLGNTLARDRVKGTIRRAIFVTISRALRLVSFDTSELPTSLAVYRSATGMNTCLPCHDCVCAPKKCKKAALQHWNVARFRKSYRNLEKVAHNKRWLLMRQPSQGGVSVCLKSTFYSQRIL